MNRSTTGHVIGDAGDDRPQRRVPEQEQGAGQNDLGVLFGGTFLHHFRHGLDLNQIEEVQQPDP